MTAATGAERLPWSPLLAFATAAFVTILTEALPAALLPQMAADLQVSQAWVGQTVTAYALGSLLAAIPLVAATRGMRRRPLLMAAMAGFVLANSVTAWSASFCWTMVARLVAGMSAGLLWALLAGYAARLVGPGLRGRAIAVAMAGTPLALSLGVPAGGWLGQWAGWRACFWAASALALGLLAWIRLSVPDFAGQQAGQRRPLAGVLRMRGVRPVLLVVLAYVLAHNLLYTYIAPYLAARGLGAQVDRALLVFGLAALPGIGLTGLLVDRHLQRLSLASTAVFGAAVAVLALATQSAPWMFAALAAWGLAFGGAATLFQTALADAAAEQADVAQSMLVTTWNAAIAGGGIAGGVLLQVVGVVAFAPVLLVLLAGAFALQVRASGSGGRRPAEGLPTGCP
ncbi:MFS transporter [Pseudorhodoferax soli]|uniref:Putative MFS family arabinose efflux permease n=1 Tax=Pseudorhodoferax soli TaxID=545864 RepID=A0A368XZF9_9BURK|nr:MFS transporter [Pseudorhodoferax soli]RCW71404.1 putative MFS family arabinose efflux permease [Pseudorhodoferax soli]